jgi:alkaline phosphatase D
MTRISQLLTAIVFMTVAACTAPRPAVAPQVAVQSGPMLGYVDLRDVLLWVQTAAPARVEIRYWDSTAVDQVRTTPAVTTAAADGNTARFAISGLEPGRTYAYEVRINGRTAARPYPLRFRTQPHWQWRTDPPPFTLATGSCFYVNEPAYDRPGTPYGSEYEIMTALYQKHPDVMLWLGDNVYLREGDWNTRAGLLHRYTHTRSLPELQPLLASTAHYAIWDDHDVGPNDADGTWIHKEESWDVFRQFWGNPTFGLPGQKGCTSYFQYHDIDFFLLDNRYYRTPNDCQHCPDRTQLGRHQLEWLKGALAASTAPFKIVATGGQVLTTSTNGETYAKLYPAERDSILRFIEREGIRGVVFLTGDKHYTELSMLRNAAGNEVYELTASSLTAGVFTNGPTVEKNANRVEGTAFGQHNFALLRFSGPRKQRELKITVCGVNGQELYSRTIPQAR